MNPTLLQTQQCSKPSTKPHDSEPNTPPILTPLRIPHCSEPHTEPRTTSNPTPLQTPHCSHPSSLVRVRCKKESKTEIQLQPPRCIQLKSESHSAFLGTLLNNAHVHLCSSEAPGTCLELWKSKLHSLRSAGQSLQAALLCCPLPQHTQRAKPPNAEAAHVCVSPTGVRIWKQLCKSSCWTSLGGSLWQRSCPSTLKGWGPSARSESGVCPGQAADSGWFPSVQEQDPHLHSPQAKLSLASPSGELQHASAQAPAHCHSASLLQPRQLLQRLLFLHKPELSEVQEAEAGYTGQLQHTTLHSLVQ